MSERQFVATFDPALPDFQILNAVAVMDGGLGRSVGGSPDRPQPASAQQVENRVCTLPIIR